MANRIATTNNESDVLTCLAFARHVNDIAQKAAEKFQDTETAWHESFERARRMRQLLSAQEPDADPRAVATTLLYVAQDLFWQSSLSSAVQAPANGQAE